MGSVFVRLLVQSQSTTRISNQNVYYPLSFEIILPKNDRANVSKRGSKKLWWVLNFVKSFFLCPSALVSEYLMKGRWS